MLVQCKVHPFIKHQLTRIRVIWLIVLVAGKTRQDNRIQLPSLLLDFGQGHVEVVLERGRLGLLDPGALRDEPLHYLDAFSSVDSPLNSVDQSKQVCI
jgi:hypothetical protein